MIFKRIRGGTKSWQRFPRRLINAIDNQPRFAQSEGAMNACIGYDQPTMGAYETAARDSARYYGNLPRWGDPGVVWTVRRSTSHIDVSADLTATVEVRRDGGVVPSIRDGLGHSITDVVMVCEPGTAPAVAIRRLIARTRSYDSAWRSLARAV